MGVTLILAIIAIIQMEVFAQIRLAGVIAALILLTMPVLIGRQQKRSPFSMSNGSVYENGNLSILLEYPSDCRPRK